MLLSKKKILVTGSSRGIGKATALECARQGADVCVHYQFSEQDAYQVADQVHQEFGVQALAIRADLTSLSEVQFLFETLQKEWGALDGMILNAASGNRKRLIDQDPEDWNRISGINVLGQISCVQNAIRFFDQPLRVLFLSSEGARYGIPDYGAIGVTKAALEAAIRQLTVELRDKPISMNGLSATLVRTAALDAVTKGQMDTFLPEYFIEAQEMAQMSAFLVSEYCPPSLKGQVIRLDNGTLSNFTPVQRSGGK